MIVRLICLIIGYVFGIFQTSYFYGKAQGIDIREHGSGNAGTTNALRVLGKKAGAIVLLGDCVKCILAILVTRMLFGANYADIIYVLIFYTACGAILGHNFPFYMNFKGGKGIAATAGLIISIHPAFLIVGLILFFGTFFITHYVSLGSLLVYAGFLIEVIVFGRMGMFGELSRGNLIEIYAITVFLTVMAYWKHRQNIVRLVHGEERKTYLSKKNEV